MELDLFWQNPLGNVLNRHHNTTNVTQDHNGVVPPLLADYHSKCIRLLCENILCTKATWLETVLSLEK